MPGRGRWRWRGGGKEVVAQLVVEVVVVGEEISEL
jgi:hypothetical protein